MRKMMKSIAAVLAVSALMAGSAFAAEKLAVKGTDGTTTKFAVSELGDINSGLNNGFYFDATNKRLGINVASPAYGLQVQNATGGVALQAIRSNTDTVNQLTGFGVANLDTTANNGISFSLTSVDNLGNPYAGAVFGAQFVSHINNATKTDIIMKTSDQSVDPSPIERLRITGLGKIGLGNFSATVPTVSGTGILHMNADTMRLAQSRTPASATAACNQGEISWDSNYVYVCTSTNSWKRAAIAGW